VDADAIVNLVLGLCELILALVVARHIGRFGRRFPWLVFLIAFFFVRGADRIYAAFADSEALGLVVDIVAIAAVVMLILGIDKTAAALKETQDEATYRSEEYARALADYQRLARHRLANPLTAIRGSVVTLRDLPDLDADARRQLLDAIEAEALRLEEVALDPELQGAEERGLDPTPNV
jgi:signal transduction histidine kinase